MINLTGAENGFNRTPQETAEKCLNDTDILYKHVCVITANPWRLFEGQVVLVGELGALQITSFAFLVDLIG